MSSDIDTDTNISFIISIVCFDGCIHISPLLHSGSRPFRLFEFKVRIGITPQLVNGLEVFCTGHQSGCHTENLLLQVWASLYRVGDNNKIMIFRSYKQIKIVRYSLTGTDKRLSPLKIIGVRDKLFMFIILVSDTYYFYSNLFRALFFQTGEDL